MKSKSNEFAKSALERTKNLTSRARDLATVKWNDAATWVAAVSVGDVADRMTKFYSEAAKQVIGETASQYDRAMDAQYIESKLGGKYHRLFDEGHDPFDAWQKVTAASETDTIAQEVIGYASAMTKDFVTSMGMPFKTMDKTTFDAMAEKLAAVPGLDKEYIYDALTTNAAELTASALSVVGLVLAFKNDDKEKVSEIIATMGVSTIASANPILGVVSVVAAAYAYKKRQISTKGLVVGGGTSVVSIAVFALFGLPLIIEIVIVLLISRQLRQNLFENEKVAAYLATRISTAKLSEILAQVQKLTAGAAAKIGDVRLKGPKVAS